MPDVVLTNARIVLPDEVIVGSVLIRNGLIADISGGTAQGDDLEGDYLIPGLVELHTDHLEGHYAPRPKVRWAIACCNCSACSGFTRALTK